MKYNEMKQAVKLLSKEWNLGKKEAGADNDICAWIYLFDVLQESERIIKYKDHYSVYFPFLKNKPYKVNNKSELNMLLATYRENKRAIL